MANAGVNKAQVFMAADRLVEQGIRPTVQNVRQALGSGSNTTINKYLREWRQSQTPLLGNNTVISETVQALVAELAERLQIEANETIAANEEAHENEREKLAEENKKLIKSLQQANKNLAETETTKQNLEENLAKLELKLKSLAALNELLEKSQQENAALKHQMNRQAEQLQDREQRITGLNEELQAVKSHEHPIIQTLEAEHNAKLSNALASQRNELLNQETQNTESLNLTHMKQIETLKDEHKKALDNLENQYNKMIETSQQSSNTAFSKLETEYADRYKDMQSKLKTLQADYANAQRELTGTKQQLHETQTENARLNEAIKTSNPQPETQQSQILQRFEEDRVFIVDKITTLLKSLDLTQKERLTVSKQLGIDLSDPAKHLEKLKQRDALFEKINIHLSSFTEENKAILTKILRTN